MADSFDIKVSETVKSIESALSDYTLNPAIEEIGTVLSVGDGFAIAQGLDKVQLYERVVFDDSINGMVLSLEPDHVKVVVLGPDASISEGSIVKRTHEAIKTPAGLGVIGRVMNCDFQPIDGKGSLDSSKIAYLDIEAPSPDVMSRKAVHEPLYTGYLAVDTLIPIGRGQRELIIGDRQTGKSTLAIDTIINQKHYNDTADLQNKVFCVYVAIGQKLSSVAKTVDLLKKTGAIEYTTVVVAGASDPASFQFIAPYIGCAMGEYFRDNGLHCLVIYDDLSKHAVAYREMSLLLRSPPGREAYPGDVFYIHSRLLERASKLSDKKGAGSLTALPIIETQAGDVSSYIATNLISITDGQIFLEADLFNSGVKPAVNVGLSVSRVGSAAQIKATKQVAGKIKLELAQFREMEAFSKFGSDLDNSAQLLIARGQKLMELLKQKQHAPLSISEQIITVLASNAGILEDIPVIKVKDFTAALLEHLKHIHNNLLTEIYTSEELSDQIKESLVSAMKGFKQRNSLLS